MQAMLISEAQTLFLRGVNLAKLLSLTLCCVMMIGNAHAQTRSPPSDALLQFLEKLGESTSTTLDAASAVSEAVLTTTQKLASRALSLIGVPYQYGGNTEAGLDCSGFVKLVFESTTSLILPRRSDEMSRVGQSVDMADLQAGDLVFFNTLRRPNSHVGIYIGDGQFVHAPSRGGKVRTENMHVSYWQKRFDGAKRVANIAP